MGLDQFVYTALHSGSESRHEIGYRRKHPNLHGWMQRVYESRGGTDSFNGVELELTRENIDQLEQDIVNGRLPHTTGFFFGENSSDYYRAQDLELCKQARADLFMGLKVFYNSSW